MRAWLERVEPIVAWVLMGFYAVLILAMLVIIAGGLRDIGAA